NHLLIGAAQAAHLREYARSWEQATSVRPRICSWAELTTPSLLPPPPPGGLVVRAASPTEEEIATLQAFAGAPAGGADVETAPAALVGMVRVLAGLDQLLQQG